LQEQRNIHIFITIFSVLCICATSYAGYAHWRNEKAIAFNAFIDDSTELNYRLNTQLNDIVQIAVNNAFLAANSPLLEQSFSGSGNDKNLQRAWQNMFLSSPTLYQIRYLDLKGNEIFRMERSANDFLWVSGEQLQAKGERDYFQRSMSNQELIYISEIDLNREQGQIEEPYRPTIRATAKYFEGGELTGLVVLNFDLRDAFAFFKLQQTRLEHWIVKQNGFFISTPTEQEWGWLLNKPNDSVTQVFTFVNESQYISDINDATWLSQNSYLNFSEINSPIADVYLAESRFWIISNMSRSTIIALDQLRLSLLIACAVLIVLIIAVARYIGHLSGQMKRNQLLAVQLADDAQTSEKAKAMFLAQMSHEIRTPMNGLFGMLQITYGERDQQKINHHLKHAMRSFEALKRIIDDILDFSKIEAGKLQLVEQRFGLDSALRDIAQIMGRSAYGKNIDMWIDIDPNCPREIVGDAIRINQILFNLTNNAIKFTEEGEVRLIVKLLSESDTHLNLGFVVKDTGIGMSKAQSEKVFNAFSQASSDTHSQFGGTGLGLTIVQQLIALMGGEIKVTSDTNSGSLFSFNIWVGKAQGTTLFSSTKHMPAHNYMEAILFTPSDIALTILKRSCSALGWTSLSLPKVSDLKHFKSTSNAQGQVVIVDDKIPLQEDDFAVLKQYKNDRHNATTVLIAKDGNFEIKQNDKSSFDRIISKPFTPSTLFDAVVTHSDKIVDLSDRIRSKEQRTLNLEGLNILIVEDNEINQMVAATMLEEAGASITLANHGKHCLELLAASPSNFDAILMDIQMPEMNGIEATTFIREQSIYDNVPIVALTANAMEHERNECIDAGMQAHVTKPIDRSELIQTIARVTSEYKTS
jgi:signal transduction histidine kinase/CheY-like chemotaxis protein